MDDVRRPDIIRPLVERNRDGSSTPPHPRATTAATAVVDTAACIVDVEERTRRSRLIAVAAVRSTRARLDAGNRVEDVFGVDVLSARTRRANPVDKAVRPLRSVSPNCGADRHHHHELFHHELFHHELIFCLVECKTICSHAVSQHALRFAGKNDTKFTFPAQVGD